MDQRPRIRRISEDGRPFYQKLQKRLLELKKDGGATGKPWSNKAIDTELGVAYRTLMYWFEGQQHTPAYVLPRLCKALESYALLDFLEEQAGRVAYFKKPHTDFVRMGDAKAIQRLAKEVGEAMQRVAETLEDGEVSDDELDRTLPELNDVIRECIHLQHLLRERNEKPSQRTTRKT